MNEQTKNTLLEIIGEYSKVLITAHTRPDSDAYGSVKGLAEGIKFLFPNTDVRVFLEEDSKLSSVYDFKSDEPFEYENDLLFISVDCADLERLALHPYGEKIIKIDHHPLDVVYGDFEWVDTSYSSASEMIADFFISLLGKDVELPLAMRLALLGGIIGDTNRFLYKNTTDRTLYLSSILKGEVDYHEHLLKPLYSQDLNGVLAYGHVISNMKKFDGVLYSIFSQSKIKELNIEPSVASNCVNAMSDIKGFSIWVLFVENEDGSYRVRIRSNSKAINHVATMFNGGGHPLASGASVNSEKEISSLLKELAKIVTNS